MTVTVCLTVNWILDWHVWSTFLMERRPKSEDIWIDVEPLVIDFTVYYSVLRPAQRPEGGTPLLLALHGYGQKCKGFVRWLAPLRECGVLVAAPQGPHQIYMQLDPKKVGFNWLTIYEKERSIRDFTGYMTRLVERLREQEEFNPNRVYVLGFSQGSAMAYRLAVSGAIPIRGVIACGADLPVDVREPLAAMGPFPVLLVHGDNDPLVNVAKAEEAETVLRDFGFCPDRYRHTAGHSMPREAVRAIGNWIARDG